MKREFGYIPAEFEPGVRSARPDAVTLPHTWLIRSGRHREAVSLAAAEILSADELRRAAAFRRSVDRDCYLAAHVGLRGLLGAHLGVGARDVELTRRPCPRCGEPHGRPAVVGEAVHFSLSHSGDLSLIALAATPVGVDTERIPSLDTVEEIGTSLHPRESAELAVLPADERRLAFARAWTRKEAYLKGIGTGLARDLSADYVGTGEMPAEAPPGWTIADVVVGDSHSAAIAIQRP